MKKVRQECLTYGVDLSSEVRQECLTYWVDLSSEVRQECLTYSSILVKYGSSRYITIHDATVFPHTPRPRRPLCFRADYGNVHIPAAVHHEIHRSARRKRSEEHTSELQSRS